MNYTPKSLREVKKKKSTHFPFGRAAFPLLETIVITKARIASSVFLIHIIPLLEYLQRQGSHSLTRKPFHFQTALIAVQPLPPSCIFQLLSRFTPLNTWMINLTPLQPQLSLLAKNPQVYLILHTGHGFQTFQHTKKHHFIYLTLKLYCLELLCLLYQKGAFALLDLALIS